MSLAQGNNTPTQPRIEPGSPDPESDALTNRLVRPERQLNDSNFYTPLDQDPTLEYAKQVSDVVGEMLTEVLKEKLQLPVGRPTESR